MSLTKNYGRIHLKIINNMEEEKQLQENLKTRIYLAQLHLQDWGYRSVIFNLYMALKVARELKKLQRKKLKI